MRVESTRHLPTLGPFEVSLSIDICGIDAGSPQRAAEMALEAIRMAVDVGIATGVSFGYVLHVCPAQGPVEGYLIKGDKVVRSVSDDL